MIKPMGFGTSILYFGIPAALFVAAFWGLMPWLSSMGMLPYYAYLLALNIPLAILLFASIAWLKVEGREVNWTTMQNRFRLKKMDKKAWLWSLVALLGGAVVGYGLVSQLSHWLIALGIIPIPISIPAFMSPVSLVDPMTAYDEAVGGMRGNWLPFFAMIITLFFNILGEEFWWRGVVLPRQELHFGGSTWIIHGVMWAFFHIFKWWDVLNLIPITLAIAFVCSRLKNTTPGIVIHSFTNGIALIPILLGILGVLG